MKYEPDNPHFWDEVDRRQVEYTELRLSRSDNELDYNNADIPYYNHAEYDNAQLPAYARDPDYIEDLKDPARAVRGIFYGILISVLFWSLLVGIVWLANTYL